MNDAVAVRVFQEEGALAEAAAELLLSAAVAAVAERGRFVLALSGGSTPQLLFERLTQAPYATEFPWRETHVLWVDERCVPPDADGSNYFLAREALLNKVALPPIQVHRMRGELEPGVAVSEYTETLARLAEEGRAWPRIDAAVMGMGADGHTASLFPGSPVETAEPVVAVTADYEGRPANRLTLTPPVLNDAYLLLFLVTGGKKAQTLADVLHGKTNPKNLPAQRIQPLDGRVVWLVDKAAAAKL